MISTEIYNDVSTYGIMIKRVKNENEDEDDENDTLADYHKKIAKTLYALESVSYKNSLIPLVGRVELSVFTAIA